MRTMLKMKALLIGGIAGMTFAASAQQVIYNNTTNDLTTRYTFGTTEIGNEITLAGTARNITLFSFEWWGVNSVHPATFSGAIQARVQFYPNAGPPFNGYATPGTPSSPTASFWDSGWFSVGNPTDRSTFIFTAGSGSDFPVGGLPITVSDMTWTVQFQGMGTGDSVGL
ncbi:MAG: hypothetical protein NT154_32770, partial [Verrucomicrobia bacterium]|nr:hypothetical protein [Verrucomicrobiota bacterium]